MTALRRSCSRRADPHWFIPTALFFVVAWLLTFNAAYVNGDDILPLAKLEFRNAFAPNFKREWVPNRMLDAYGRDLLAAGFDLWFFSLRTVVPVDFFLLFKAYAATLHAAFLTIVLGYIHRRASAAGRPVGRLDDAVIWCFLAVAVLGLFPWRNQTYFVAYQLAAFLCFVLLNEITRLLVALVPHHDGDAPVVPAPGPGRYAALILLSFICAFSLEVYAAIVLLCLALPAALVMRAMLRARRASGQASAAQARLMPVAMVLLVAICFCAIAVLVTIATSQRADVARSEGTLVFAGLGDSAAAWLPSRRGVIALLLAAIPLGVVALLRRGDLDGRVGSGALARDVPGERRRDPQTWMHGSAMAAVVIATIVITAIASIMAGYDYFSQATYPWGAFLLVAKLFVTYAVVLVALSLSRRDLALRSAVLLLAFVAASKGALDVLGSAYASHRTSEQLHRMYDTLGTASGGSIAESGLDLASMEMQARPLPTIDSPEWFVAAFERFFEKYFGVTGRTLFR